MPNFNDFGPSSTSQLYLENQYRLFQSQAADWERNLQAQRLSPEDSANAFKDKQEELDKQVAAFQAKAEELRQTQSMIDGGLIDPIAGMEAMWATVLPRETMQAMYPKQPEVSKREPLSAKEMEELSSEGGSIEQFASQAEMSVTKRHGPGGIDWMKRDIKVRSQASIMKMYRAWKTNIGYGEGTQGLTPIERRQVDGEWDAWVAEKGKSWKWDTTSKYVRAERATGPFTRSYGQQFRQAPTGPREAIGPFQLSIAQALPKKTEPGSKLEPRIWAKNPKTKKRLYSDDGGKTWHAE